MSEMNPFWGEEASFEVWPDKSVDEAVHLGTPSDELKGNSAEGNVIEGFEKGLGRFASYNRDHTSYEVGGAPEGSEVTPVFPSQTGDNYFNSVAAGKAGMESEEESKY